MRPRSFIALGLIALLTGGAQAGKPIGPARFVGAYVWRLPDKAFGGFSGLELSRDGRRFTSVSDHGSIVAGRLLRDNSGRISAVRAGPIRRLKRPDGRGVNLMQSDSEGLAMRDGGPLFVSFERIHRVWKYPRLNSNAVPLPRHPDFRKMQINSSLEALAIGPDGALYTLPERSGAPRRPFPVYRYQGGKWSQPFSIPRRGAFLASGADFGPDGKFYLLERRFELPFGFATRVRRFTITGNSISDETLILQTHVGRFDNLEGLALWRDKAGLIRLTMISDDNFNALQRTEFVEYRLPKQLEPGR